MHVATMHSHVGSVCVREPMVIRAIIAFVVGWNVVDCGESKLRLCLVGGHACMLYAMCIRLVERHVMYVLFAAPPTMQQGKLD